MSAIAFPRRAADWRDPEAIREGMSGNLCRCGAYAGIVEAVLDAGAPAANTRKDAA